MARARKRSLSSRRGSSMSSSDLPRFTRLLMVLALAGLTAGCFQPLYGDRASVATPGTAAGGVLDKMRSVNVAPVVTSLPGRLPRVGGEVRNELIYQLTGGGD